MHSPFPSAIQQLPLMPASETSGMMPEDSLVTKLSHVRLIRLTSFGHAESDAVH